MAFAAELAGIPPPRETGVNDAPVLRQAQVSLAMAGGTDLVQTSADMVVLGADLGRVSAALATARQTTEDHPPESHVGGRL